MGGVEYTCYKRKTPAGTHILWITTILIDKRHDTAVFDARTRKLKASLFLTASQFFDILAHLEAKHAALFD